MVPASPPGRIGPRWLCLALPLVCWQGFAFPAGTAAAAPWREGDAVLLTIDEAAPALAASLGAVPAADLPGDTPLLLPRETADLTAKDWNTALVLSGLALREEAGHRTVIRRADLAERRLLLAAAPPAAAARRGGGGGIAAGLVAVGGRFLGAPYDVEVAGGEVLINGVRVFPAPEIDRPLPPADPGGDRRDAILQAAARRYRDDGDRAALLARLAAAPALAGATWVTESRVRLDWANEDSSYLELEPLRAPEPPDPEAWLRLATGFAEQTRTLLAADGVLLAGVGYCLPLPDLAATTWSPRVGEILAAGETGALTILRLQAYTRHREAALDLYLAATGR